MNYPFTEHVRALERGSDVSDEVLESLERVLRQHLNRLGIYEMSPTLLGYSGTSWRDAAPMEDLVADCYIFSILDRLRALKAQLKECENVDGFVRLNVRNFLYEKQRQVSPARYALFKNLEAALTEAVAGSLLTVQGLENKRMTADCVFRMPEAISATPVTADLIREVLSGKQGHDESLLGLTRRSNGARVIANKIIQALIVSAIKSFRFRDLFDALVADIESTAPGTCSTRVADRIWDGTETPIRMVRSNGGYEDKEQLNATTERIREAINKLDRRETVRARIRRVLDCIVETVLDGQSVEELTYADVGRKLGIARATLNEDIQTIRKLCDDYCS